MRFSLVLLLAMIGANSQPVYGKAFTAIKAKASSVAAQWLPKVGQQAVTLSLIATMSVAPLVGAEESQFAGAARESARRTNLQLKDEIEALNVGLVVDKQGQVVSAGTSPYSALIGAPSHFVLNEENRQRWRALEGLAMVDLLEATGQSTGRSLPVLVGQRDELLRMHDQYFRDPEFKENVSEQVLDYFREEWLYMSKSHIRVFLSVTELTKMKNPKKDDASIIVLGEMQLKRLVKRYVFEEITVDQYLTEKEKILTGTSIKKLKRRSLRAAQKRWQYRGHR